MTETRTIRTAGLETGVTIHRPDATADRHVGILYLHGGGLLYGERDDLPAIYVGELVRAGFTLVCLDYPLAPETPLPQITAAVLEGWAWFAHELAAELGLGSHFLFGRSSGAYLALVLARDIHRAGLAPEPLGILDFYGYHDLMDPAFWEPCATYTSLPVVSEKTVLALTSGGPVTSGPFELRFALYIHARQTGDWVRMLGVDEDRAREQSLTPDDVAALPPLFVTASTDDGDVPYRIPKSLFRAKRGTKMVTVYHLEHDFDRDVSKPEGLDTYRQAITWMEGRLAV